jgi:hypothetical protein
MARELDIEPQPDDAERAAIEAALAVALEDGATEPDAWWEAGVRGASDSEASD